MIAESPTSPRRLRPAITPAQRAKKIDRFVAIARMVARTDTTITDKGGDRSLDFGPAKALLLSWIDADGRVAATWTVLGDPLTEAEGRALTNVAGSVMRRRDSASAAIIDANEHRQKAVAYDERCRREAVAAEPWSCDFCARRFKTERGAVAHERACTGGQGGRNGHRLVSVTCRATAQPTVIYSAAGVETRDNSRTGFVCSCGHRHTFDALVVARTAIARSFVRHASDAG